ncbi:C6 zinc finger domain-containing protein [Colletotrichum graminicola M1.001]|uniref:C6 zinc finger domain-containing protein n=1 Tax=Colletotrichum graminicola (strain M1.001 / M2 / FGSC 10212) TaxID=645133 RepID=E3QQN1_COLGM|nr:C6 zinc finger domain-containing protein [Colletotrichum graminicola M1.001]EFQ33169.1 C6 zinc finger domain-containing protein [Colletotrichum graminicola M1.001]
MPPRFRDAADISGPVQERWLQASPESQALHISRPILADIDGTRVERLYFHRFRRVAEAGLCNHVTNLTSFWSRLAPQLSHSNEAVKHAIVALGSAFHIYQTAPPPGGGEAIPRELEIFTIQQYNTAMSKLSSYANVPMEDRINVILLCCVSFLCIEALRNNWRAALTHLSNGLRIIESLPMSTLNKLRDSLPSHRSSSATKSMLGMDYILRLFATWEISCAMFAENFKPVISIKLYEGREFDDTPLEEFETIIQAHQAIVQYTRDVFALVWKTRKHQGDDEFWSWPLPRRQHEILMGRGESLTGLFERFMERPEAPASGTKEYYSVCLDMLHYKCARLLCHTLHQKPYQRQQSPGIVAQHADLVSIAALLYRGLAVSCQDPMVQESALAILQDYPQRENLWDGNLVHSLLVAVENANYRPAHLLEEPPHSLAFGKGIPALYEKLHEPHIQADGN